MTQVGKKPTEPKPTDTDWERVKREAAQDVRVSFDPAQPEGPLVCICEWQLAHDLHV